MMKITIDSAQFRGVLKKIRALPGAIQKKVIEKGLAQSGAFMVSSLQAGFSKSKNPQGEKWEKLHFPFRPDDDGVIRPPKRPTTPDSKPLVNTGGLRNDLTFEMVGGKAVVIGYGTPDFQKIAHKHHFGIASQAKIQYPGKEPKFITIRPFQRKNIGFATWARLGAKNDIGAITAIFSKQLQDIAAGNF